MKRLVYLLLVLFLYTSCSKRFKDEKLVLCRRDFTGDQLRIDGFYYGDPGEKLYSLYVFYRNGIFLDLGASVYEEMEKHVKELFTFNHAKSKYAWGVYHVNGTEILINRWDVGWRSLPVYFYRGEILNDTTFVLRECDGKSIEEQVFHFRHSIYRPDSTNHYIP